MRYSLTNPHAYVGSNLAGFLNILEACRHHPVQHLVYASSSSVYGGNTRLPFSESDNVDHPVSLYAATKKANELMAHTYSHLFGLPTTGLRFFTVYGPWGRPDMALFLFTKAILDGRAVDVFNHGKMQRDFTYIDDIVEGVVRVLDRAPQPDPAFDTDDARPGALVAPYRVFNIGNHGPAGLLEYIDALEEALGRKAERNYLPMQPGDVPATFADTTLLTEWTGHKPGTPIREGIRRFVEWYVELNSASEGVITVEAPTVRMHRTMRRADRFDASSHSAVHVRRLAQTGSAGRFLQHDDALTGADRAAERIRPADGSRARPASRSSAASFAFASK